MEFRINEMTGGAMFVAGNQINIRCPINVASELPSDDDSGDVTVEKLELSDYRYIAIKPGGVFNGKTYTKKTLLFPNPSSVTDVKVYFEGMFGCKIKAMSNDGSMSFSSNMNIFSGTSRFGTICIGDNQINIR